jgi:hypothetical protein
MAEPLITIPKFIGNLNAPGLGPRDISVRDVRELQRRLKEIEPRLRTQIMRDVKALGKPIERQIKAGITQITPPSGMLKSRGRLGWGVMRPADATQLQFRTRMPGRSLTTSLLRVRVTNPATTMADMAGRSKRWVGKGTQGTGRTRDFSRPSNGRSIGTVMSRKVTKSAGNKWISRLNRMQGIGKNKASRFIYPSAEKSIPAVSQEVERVLRSAYAFINRQGL